LTSPSTKSLGHNQAKEWSTTGREAPGASWAQAGQARPDRAGVRRERPGRCRLGSGMAGAVRSGAGHGWGGSSGARRSDAREREKWEKERVGLGTIPTYVRRADTSVDEHKRSGLCGCRWCLMFIGHPMNISYVRRF
jgi:hypothetical protein